MTATIADAAVAYAARGWKPVPVGRKTKKPIGKAWQTRPFSPDQFNANAQNVAIQLGPESKGLVDVDLDNMAAIGFAPEFLPPTDAIFGRRSKPASHQLYITSGFNGEKRGMIQFKDNAGAVLVELRIGCGGKGATTVFPPSMHTSGEMVEWVTEGDPAHVEAESLKRSVLKLAVACLLKQYYPGPGSRHDGALVIGGVLARAGWQADDIGHVVGAVACAVGDDECEDRVGAATSAIHVKANGHDVAGLPRLRAVWGDDVAKVLAKWLGYQEHKSGEHIPEYSEEALALRFAEQHADYLRYVAFRSRWLLWDGCRWLSDQTLVAFDRARLICRQHAAECQKIRTASALASAKTVAAVERLAKADRRLAATADQWDATPDIINTPTKEPT